MWSDHGVPARFKAGAPRLQGADFLRIRSHESGRLSMKISITKGLATFTLTVLAVFAWQPAQALGNYPYAIPCTGCSNPTIVATIRENYGSQSSWFVYDLNSRQLRYFYKVATSRGQYNVQERAPDAKAQAYWKEVMDFYDHNGRRLSLNIRLGVTLAKSSSLAALQTAGVADGLLVQPSSIPGPPNVTAWDAINEGTYRQQVMNYLNTQTNSSSSGIFARAAELVGTTYAKITIVFGGISRDQLGLNIQALSLTVTVAYSDGSSQQYAWDPLNHTWAYIPHTSVDSSGNTIPDGPSDVSGQNGNAKIYMFSNTPGGSADAISWFQRVNLFQISAPSPNTPAVIACVTTGSGGAARTTCTAQR